MAASSVSILDERFTHSVPAFGAGATALAGWGAEDRLKPGPQRAALLRFAPLVWASLFACAIGSAARGDERVDYVRAVKPILTARCYACHGALQQKAGLRLDTLALMKKGGDNGPVIVPGKSSDSLLLAHITASNGARRMPPSSEGEGLTRSQVALIRAWLDQGAAAPAGEKPEPDPRDHWAFRPPVRPPLPRAHGGWAGNPIDAFVAAGHARHGLAPQGPADRQLLLRRVYLDLVGLPPTRQEQADFLADQRPDAYEKVVDRLLASKLYGERWGRRWMDVWRYSDWWGLGAEVRNSQKHIWHWRDWIVESLNADKGYDQMVREMLAADELYPTDADRLRGTGFLARSYFKFNRNTWLEEVVEHTSKAFLGLTMNCTRCHDHKYDPITQQDFYRFRAFFEPYQVRTDMVAGEADFEKAGLPRVFDCNLTTPTYLFVRGDERQPRTSKPLAPGLPAILLREPLDIRPVSLPPEAHTPGLRVLVLDNHLRLAQQQIATARAALEQARKTLAEIEKKSRTVAKEAKPQANKPIVVDDFSQAKPDWWETKTGKWLYQDKKLLQQQDGPTTRAVLRLRPAVPADFQARFKFTPTGGQMWKSVGLSFDVAAGNEVLVYLSASAGGPKLQIAYKRGGDYVYPPGAALARPVKLNEPQEMVLQVRGSIVNVAVNGKHALAYRLPIPRRTGAIELITYDARAEFTAFELAGLPPGVKLVAPGTPAPAPSAPTTVEQARLAVVVAEKALAATALQPDLHRARFAADRARYAQPPAAGVKELEQQAARAERQFAVARAEEAVARAELEAALAPDRTKEGVTTKVTASRAALTAARKALEVPGESYTSLRGALKTLESNVETEASRSKPFPTTSSGRRSALARWITAADNPLTARVAVNHVWARHFGKPLVGTVFDFGRKGEPPTHPELLDWLAVELTESGWSMKHLHRLIVTSRTYRMTSSAAGRLVNRKVDPENRWYWRMNPVRMEAQVIRDSLLHLAGELGLTTGGPPIAVADQTSRRRSLYFVHSHNDHHRFLSMFDDASVLECYRRAESIIPQQALSLQNSRLALTAAEKIAARLDTPELAADAAYVRAAFELVLGCTPTTQEQAACTQALTELVALATREKRPNPAQRARATLVHALLNHNDFVTVR
jgi:hypothetical protein